MERVLRALAQDARQTAAQIAESTGESEAEVAQYLEEAESQGIIRSWGARINWETLGLGTVYAVVEVTVEPQEGVGYNSVARRIARFDEARTVYFVSGAYDLLVMVEAPNMGAISDFVGERLATMPGVKGTTTRVLMRRYKEDGVMLESDPESDRQSVVF